MSFLDWYNKKYNGQLKANWCCQLTFLQLEKELKEYYEEISK